jgi:hypothetical protein
MLILTWLGLVELSRGENNVKRHNLTLKKEELMIRVPDFES